LSLITSEIRSAADDPHFDSASTLLAVNAIGL